MQTQDSTPKNQALSSALSPEQGPKKGESDNKNGNQTSIPEIQRPTKPSEEQPGRETPEQGGSRETKKDRGLADFVPRKRNNQTDEEGFYFPRR